MLKGIDISKYQATTPNLTGLSFVFVRAAYGATVTDPLYKYHAANVRAANLVLGAYIFGRNQSGKDQANYLLSIAKDADLLVLDLESDGPFPRMTDTQVKEFFATIHAAGRKAGLYHSLSGFPNLGQDWNWVAYWGSTVPPSIPWTFWQYRGSPLDLDWFVGDKAALNALAHPVVPHTLHIASGTKIIREAVITGGCISSYRSYPWSGKASSAPSTEKIRYRGCSSGSAYVTTVTGGVFKGKRILVDGTHTTVTP